LELFSLIFGVVVVVFVDDDDDELGISVKMENMFLILTPGVIQTPL
jgi:hypothetical protein